MQPPANLRTLDSDGQPIGDRMVGRIAPGASLLRDGPLGSTRMMVWTARNCRRLRMFCIPHAGVGASAFREWPNALPADVELCALQLPGREHRLAEAPSESIEAVVDKVLGDISGMLDVPFAFFGHSMGALVAFEAARELRRRGLPPPVHVVVSAMRAPQMPRRIPELHRLPDARLLTELKRLGGTPPEVFEHQELLALVLRVLRADLQACETYEYLAGDPLGCPISAWGGRLDADVRFEELAAWSRETTGPFDVQRFDGGHFFPFVEANLAAAAVAQTLARYPEAAA